MSYLLTQMFLYMLCALLLGLILGWLIWRYGKPSASESDAIRDDRDALLKERGDLNTNLDACRVRSTKLREENDALKATNFDLSNRINALGVKKQPVVETPKPAAVAAPAAAFSGTASKPEGLSGPRGGKADDLKEISGVGPKMEGLLNHLGYYHFDQIAAWSPSEVAWVDDNLEGFKGRVTRDNWIAQAGKLA